jgi:serine/threonine-protein kinase
VGKIGRYDVEAEIGRGAMGVVNLAHDPRLHRQVAVKTFHVPDALSEVQREEFQERFLREARAAASLSHPGIVTVYDVDWDGDAGLPFIAMEYVPGATLKQRLEERGRLEPDEALDMVDALAAALGAAHAAGIVHRDVKPANVLLREPDGAVKIADFGVARCSTSELTRSGMALGSPAYMAPEQIRGRSVDARADLFSLGVILYESLCGQRPFEGEDLSALAYSVAHETPIPIHRRVEGLPAGIDTFLATALAKAPADRFADAEAMRTALALARETDPPDPAESTRVDRDVQPVSPRTAAGATPSLADQRSGGFATPAGGASLDRFDSPLGAFGAATVSRRGRAGLLAILALGLLFLAGAWMLRGGDARLELDGRSSVADGDVSLVVDGSVVWSRRLAAERPSGRGKGKGKKLLNKLIPSKAESFEASIDIDAGRHEIEAILELTDEDLGTETYRSSVIVELESGETRKLRLSAGRAFGAPVSLKLD